MYTQRSLLMQKKASGQCDVRTMTLLFATRPSCLHQLSAGELPATRVSGVSLFLSLSHPFTLWGGGWRESSYWRGHAVHFLLWSLLSDLTAWSHNNFYQKCGRIFMLIWWRDSNCKHEKINIRNVVACKTDRPTVGIVRLRTTSHGV
jgi:hypothetical protein